MNKTFAVIAFGTLLASHAYAGQDQTICQHVSVTWPTDHLVIKAPGISIDCVPASDKPAFVVSWDKPEYVLWYATHDGQRQFPVVDGEGDDD